MLRDQPSSCCYLSSLTLTADDFSPTLKFAVLVCQVFLEKLNAWFHEHADYAVALYFRLRQFPSYPQTISEQRKSRRYMVEFRHSAHNGLGIVSLLHLPFSLSMGCSVKHEPLHACFICHAGPPIFPKRSAFTHHR